MRSDKKVTYFGIPSQNYGIFKEKDRFGKQPNGFLRWCSRLLIRIRDTEKYPTCLSTTCTDVICYLTPPTSDILSTRKSICIPLLTEYLSIMSGIVNSVVTFFVKKYQANVAASVASYGEWRLHSRDIHHVRPVYHDDFSFQNIRFEISRSFDREGWCQ